MIKNLVGILLPLTLAISLIFVLTGDLSHYFSTGDAFRYLGNIIPDVNSIVGDLNYVIETIWSVPVLNIILTPFIAIISYAVALPLIIIGNIIGNIFGALIQLPSGTPLPSLPSYPFENPSEFVPSYPSDWISII